MQSVVTQAPETSTSRSRQTALSAALVFVFMAYLAQCASPLRLINDGVDYLLQASSALDGHGFLHHGMRSMRPPGYPAEIFVLAKLGLGTSWAFVALNCIMLGIGAWAAYYVVRAFFGFSRELAQLLCLLTLCSYVMVRNATYPLSDISYFGLSVPCLLMLAKVEAEEGSRRWLWLISVIPLIVISIEVRTIGIALVPAFLWAGIGGMQGAQRISPFVRRYRVLVAVMVLIATLVAGEAFLHSRYMQFNLPTFQRRGVLHSIVANIGYHTGEWGELTSNAPLSKLPTALEFPIKLLGAFAILTFTVGLWIKRRQLDALMLYTMCGACIVFGYPWFDTRLWLPFVPFLLGYMLLGLQRMFPARRLRPLLLAYSAYFCVLGIAALAYSTRISYAGARFPELFGDGNFQATYRLALNGEQPRNGSQIDPDALYLLRRFEPRTKQ